MSDRYALLIGVDYYFPNRLPDGGYYPSLGGCVRDVRHVEAHLRDRLGIADDHLLTLRISNTGGAQPPEPPEQWPTYANMVAKFQQLTNMAQPDDQVYIHYSGHGGRAATIYAPLKGESGLDETLVPTDIGNPESRYLRDVEMYSLLKAMVDKGLAVTMVLDSCHSGGATRGVGKAAARGIASIDTTPRPTDSLVASAAELLAAWQSTGGTTRAMKPASGWLLEPQGYTLLAACRANESAYEYPFNGSESNGALTYWMLDTLREADATISYKMLHDRILAKVHGQFEQQTPMLQGEGNRAVFGSALIPPVYTVLVLQVDLAGRRVQLGAGEVHGLVPGVQFALYPAGVTDFSRPENRWALVEVRLVDAVDSWAEIIEQHGQGPLEAGAQAVLQQATNVRLQRGVGVAIEDPARRGQVENAIAAGGKGFIAVAQTGERVDFQVALSDNRETFELWDAAGVALPNLRPALAVADPGSAARVVARLIHLAKYRNVQDLAVADKAAPQKLRVELVGVPADAGEAPIFRPGDKVTLQITNLLSPNAADLSDPSRILNITVLDLASDWSIQQIYPSQAGAFEPVQPGASLPLELDAYLPDGYTESTDIVKVFATRATTQFRWLELPALDQPDTRSKTRGLITDPLEQMLAQITGGQAPTRAIRVTNAPGDAGWAVGQVEVRVKT